MKRGLILAGLMILALAAPIAAQDSIQVALGNGNCSAHNTPLADDDVWYRLYVQLPPAVGACSMQLHKDDQIITEWVDVVFHLAWLHSFNINGSDLSLSFTPPSTYPAYILTLATIHFATGNDPFYIGQTIPAISADNFSFVDTLGNPINYSYCISPLYIVDANQRDTLIIGNLDHSPMVVSPGQQVAVPVWFYSTSTNIADTMTFAHIPVASNDNYVTARSGGVFHWPMSEWDDAAFLLPNPNSPTPGYTSQSILGFACLSDSCDHGVWLHTNGLFRHIADFTLTISPDTLVIGDTSCLVEGLNPANGAMIFGSGDGAVAYYPYDIYGLLQIERMPGDANFTGGVNGIDVTYLVNYFKTGESPPRPFLSGDANGDCNVNGIDVVYLVAYLKGIGGAPIRGDCGD